MTLLVASVLYLAIMLRRNVAIPTNALATAPSLTVCGRIRVYGVTSNFMLVSKGLKPRQKQQRK